MTAQLGSIYDIPLKQDQLHSDQKQAAPSTAAGTSLRFDEMSGNFGETEGAKYKPKFSTFYSDPSVEAKYTTINKFEGISSYFSYYPTDDIKE